MWGTQRRGREEAKTLSVVRHHTGGQSLYHRCIDIGESKDDVVPQSGRQEGLLGKCLFLLGKKQGGASELEESSEVMQVRPGVKDGEKGLVETSGLPCGLQKVSQILAHL